MTYIYDILVNFSDNLYEFYEWNKKDKIIHIKRIPLIKVKSKVMEELCFNNIKVDKKFLELINIERRRLKFLFSKGICITGSEV